MKKRKKNKSIYSLKSKFNCSLKKTFELSFFLIFFGTLLSPERGMAEYRVYLHKIVYIPTQAERLVKSTLDVQQYRLYFQVGSNETIENVDTWMCFGRTDYFANLCPKPIQISDETSSEIKSSASAGLGKSISGEASKTEASISSDGTGSTSASKSSSNSLTK